MMLSFHANAQDGYRKMLTDGKEWHCFWNKDMSGDETDGMWLYNVAVVGDSVINGVTYKKLCREYTETVPKGTERISYFAAREKDGKVYLYDNEKGDVTLMDFSLHKGDAVPSFHSQSVLKEDPVEVYGTKYRRLVLSGGGIWVEGIGCNIFYDTLPYFQMEYGTPYVDENYFFTCYDKGKLVFTENDFLSVATGLSEIRGAMVRQR